MAVEAKIMKITVKTNNKRLYEVDYLDGAVLLCKDELEAGAVGVPFEVKDLIRNKCAELDEFITRQGTVVDIKENDTISAVSFTTKVVA